MLFTTFILPKSIFLFISIPYPNQVYDKQRKNISLWWFVCCMSGHEIFFPGWYFPAFSRLYQKKFSCCQPLSRSLVNTSLISQFWENVRSFNFLANALEALLMKHYWSVTLKWSITMRKLKKYLQKNTL